MTKICKPKYLAKVKLLTKEETERLFSRMAGKLPHRVVKDKISKEEALAIQMELEDEHLQEWRKMMQMLKKKDEAKTSSKPKVVEKAKISSEPKAKTLSKPKAVEKAKVVKKPKATEKVKAEPGK